MTSGVVRASRRRAVRLLSVAALATVVSLGISACSADTSVSIDVPTQVDGVFPAEVQSQFQSAVADAMAATASSGAIVGVWAPWSGSWVAGVGSQGAGGAAVTDDLTFPIGQVTRTMTCDVLYALDAAGSVDASDPVSKWVSGMPDEKEVTLGQLCEGTSGFASYQHELLGSWLANPTRVWNPRELASYGLGAPRTGAPGVAWSDSDTGYTLLGLALERAGGATMATLYQRYVFRPLALSSASFPTAVAPTTNSLLGYQALAGADGSLACATPTDLSNASPSIGNTDASVRTDIRDLGRYAQALASRSLPATPTNRFETVMTMDPGNPQWLTTSGGAMQAGSLIGQSGALLGHATAAFADPTTGLTVAVALNSSTGNPYLVEYLAWELAALASKAAPASGQAAPGAGLPWTAQQFHDIIAANPVCPVAAG